jgi:hypothetical protein
MDEKNIDESLNTRVAEMIKYDMACIDFDNYLKFA